MSRANPHDLPLAKVRQFETGKPVTFEYLRNTEKAPRDPNNTFAQNEEPAGRFMIERDPVVTDVSKGWESGTVTFEHPLVIEHGDGLYTDPTNWKKILAKRFKATGKRLTKKLLDAGYDGIVTVRNGDTSEIVDLTPLGQRKVAATRDIAFNFDQPQTYQFNEKDYRPAVVKWAKAMWGDKVAPNGKPVYQNFVRWFGDSQVVDENGEPLKVYHGGAAGVTEFDPKRSGSVLKSDWGPGIHFTPVRWMANEYRAGWAKATDAETNRLYDAMVEKAKEHGTDPMSAWLDLEYNGKNPEGYKEIKAREAEWRSRLKEVDEGGGGDVYAVYLKMDNPLVYTYGGITEPYLSLDAKASGHDGVIIQNEGGHWEELIVFEPNQIKSATDNRGTFDAENPSIVFAKHTLTRKALDYVDKVIGTDEYSTTRALENVVNKGLQQLKKADEDAYEQVLKLAGTAAHATLEAMQSGTRDPAFIDALRRRHLEDVRITLELAGLAQRVTKGSSLPATVAGKPAVMMRIGDVPYYVPKWLKGELQNAIDDPHSPNVIQKLVDKLDTYGMAGPLDLFYHGTNVIATIIGGTPYAGTDILSRTIGNTPATKWLTALINIWRMNPETILAKEPGLLREMANAGVIPTSYGGETYSKKAAAMGIGKRTFKSLSPLLRGPKGLDIRTRILMWKIGKAMNPSATPTEMNDFVNQLGIYDKALQSQAVRFLTTSRIGRFAVAGTTMTKNGVLSWLNKNPLPTEDLPFAQRASLRAQQQFGGGPLGIALILWLGASLLYRGMLPWKDKQSQFMRIPLNDRDRHSPLVERIYGPDGDVFVNLGFFSPLLERGGRALGINDAYNTAILGGNTTQIGEAALTSAMNTTIHPISTSPTTKAVFEGLTGNEMSIKGVRSKEGKSTVEMWPLDLPEGAGTGRKALEGALDLNPFVGNIVHSFGVNRSDKHPNLLTDSENRILLQSVLDMSLPRLVKKTDLGKKRGYIKAQKRAMK